MNGILNINKPSGRTSFSVVSLVKRLSGERRVGHAGTLDPLASGVLPVCLGQGTRVIEFLFDATKVYVAQIELGVTTDTYDASGKITRQADPSGISREQFESALASFCGLIQQTPPMYSAVRHKGQKLYTLARSGIEVERKARAARVHRLVLTDWQPPLATIEVECGKGTYIRSLAHDLGQALGCGASLKNLIRSRCGPFDIADAVSIPQLEEAFHEGGWQDLVFPIDCVLTEWKAVVVSDVTADMIRKGQAVTLDAGAETDLKDLDPASTRNRCRAYTTDGQFVGVLRFCQETGLWRPEKVFPLSAQDLKD